MFKNNKVLFLIALIWLIWAVSIKDKITATIVFAGFTAYMGYIYYKIKK